MFLDDPTEHQMNETEKKCAFEPLAEQQPHWVSAPPCLPGPALLHQAQLRERQGVPRYTGGPQLPLSLPWERVCTACDCQPAKFSFVSRGIP